ncbi:DNA translocase FtsK [Bacillus infantis]|uniref:DNA translocase FtsK n=1 Tax=Bacillus infantis TaxID=324767 RepID=UPI002FBE2C6B
MSESEKLLNIPIVKNILELTKLTLNFDEQTASISFLQRRLIIAFTFAAMIMDSLEEEGVVGP